MSKKRELVLLLVWPFLASLLSILLSANVFESIILFLFLPSCYLASLYKCHIKRVSLFAFILSVPLAVVVDYVMELTGGWYLPYSVFGEFRLFGYVTLEQILWLFLYVFYVVMFYEYFLEKGCKPLVRHSRLKFLVVFLGVVLATFFAVLVARPSWLHIDFFYLKFGLFFGLIPLIAVVWHYDKLWTKFALMVLYFSMVSFVYEITALHLNQWLFPARNQFVGWLSFGHIQFPFEELFFWIFLGGACVVAYYELFYEDLR